MKMSRLLCSQICRVELSRTLQLSASGRSWGLSNESRVLLSTSSKNL